MFIAWPVGVDAEFQSAFNPLAPGHNHQKIINADATYYAFASTHLTESQCIDLQGGVSPDILYGAGPEDVGWDAMPLQTSARSLK